jgi:hypothetical protein
MLSAVVDEKGKKKKLREAGSPEVFKAVKAER